MATNINNLPEKIPSSPTNILNMRLKYDKNSNQNQIKKIIDPDPHLETIIDMDPKKQNTKRETAAFCEGINILNPIQDNTETEKENLVKQDNTMNETIINDQKIISILKDGENLIVPLIKNFIMKLRNATIYRPLVNLKQNQMDILDDNCFLYEEKEEKTNVFQLFCTIFKKYKFIKKISFFFQKHTFHPYGTFRTCCDLLHFFLLITLFFIIPVDTVFEGAQDYDGYRGYLIFTIIMFAIDICLNLNTSYFQDGCLEMSRRKIFNNYFKGLFICDFLPIVAIFLCLTLNYSESEHGHYFSFVKLFMFSKLSRFRWLYKKLTSQFKIQQNFKGYLDLGNLLFMSILISHLIATSWIMISTIYKDVNGDNSITWIRVKKLDTSPWYIQYLYSFYWSITTMMTVGYGDIVPQNSVETLYASIIIMFGCGVYAYNINAVGILLEEIRKEENIYHHNLRIINKFMDRKFIDNELQTRVREYLRFIWNEEKTQNDLEEIKIIESLNYNLKEELLLKSYGAILKRFPMFYANFSEKSLRKMVMVMKEIRFTPMDSIFIEEEIDDSAIYFINKGKVELFLTRTDKESNILIQNKFTNDCFGEVSFFTGQPREISAKSLDFISVFVIKRNDFIEIINENPEDYQKFCMIKDQILLYNNYQNLRLRCASCNSLDHTVKYCPFLHYLPDIEKIIKKYEYYNDQSRKQIVRKPRVKAFNSRFFFIKNQKAAISVQKSLKKEKESLKNALMRKKFQEGEYDTVYFNSEVSLTSEESSDSSDDSQINGDTDTIHTETTAKDDTKNLPNNSQQISQQNNTSENIISVMEKSGVSFDRMEKSNSKNYEKDISREKKISLEKIPEIPDYTKKNNYKSEENLNFNLHVTDNLPAKRYSAMEEKITRNSFSKNQDEKPTFNSISNKRNSLMNFPPGSINTLQGLRFLNPNSRLGSSNNITNNDKQNDKMKESNNSFHVDSKVHSDVMTRNRTKRKTKKNHSNASKIESQDQIHSNILNSKISIGNPQINTLITKNDLNIFFDQVGLFKNYFPDMNAQIVLDAYDKKRKKMAFLHEMKIMTNNSPSHKNEKKNEENNNNLLIEEIKEIENNNKLKKISKYTFYASKMQEKMVDKRKSKFFGRKKKDLSKRTIIEGKRSTQLKKKKNFFENDEEENKKKGFADFILQIMRDPKFKKWKKYKNKP